MQRHPIAVPRTEMRIMTIGLEEGATDMCRRETFLRGAGGERGFSRASGRTIATFSASPMRGVSGIPRSRGAGGSPETPCAGASAAGIACSIPGRTAEEMSAAMGGTIFVETAATGMSGSAYGFRTMMGPPHLRQRKRIASDYFSSDSFRRKRDRHDSHSTTMAMRTRSPAG